MEAVQVVDRETQQWREIGRSLASIHQIKGDRCGFERQGYYGPLYQDNRPLPDWLSFYTERRLWPYFSAAINSGNLPASIIRQVDQLIARLPKLDIPECQPCLLHGDAQQNNFLSTPDGALVIDPAIYFGNPELDLAALDYFQPVPEDVFSAYQEIQPIEPGFGERRLLWRVAGYLAAVAVEGEGYLNMLSNAVQSYL
jgi:fructosamine-3-kinase